MKDDVNHPDHYNQHPADIECIDVVEHMSFNLGNAIKYLWRHGLKHGPNDPTDLRKAIWYIEREIERRAGEPTRAEIEDAELHRRMVSGSST